MDAGTYAVARWGVERAALQGIPVRCFPHHDVAAARALIRRDRHCGGRPIVVTDGYCPACGKAAPLAKLLRCVEPRGGRLVIDDTQALGVLGEDPTPHTPYGRGGGGSLPWHGVASPHLIAGSSLAKGFGVPLAVLSGSERVIRQFEECSETRVHSSPPSIAALRAAEHALAANRLHGDGLRFYLSQLVERFRAGLQQIGLMAEGGPFPVQMLPLGGYAQALHLRLLCAGIRTVLVRCCRGLGTRLGFLITALHRPADIDQAVEVLGHLCNRTLLARA